MINHASYAAMLLCACTQALRPPTLLAPRQRSQALRATSTMQWSSARASAASPAALLARPMLGVLVSTRRGGRLSPLV